MNPVRRIVSIVAGGFALKRGGGRAKGVGGIKLGHQPLSFVWRRSWMALSQSRCFGVGLPRHRRSEARKAVSFELRKAPGSSLSWARHHSTISRQSSGLGDRLLAHDNRSRLRDLLGEK